MRQRPRSPKWSIPSGWLRLPKLPGFPNVHWQPTPARPPYVAETNEACGIGWNTLAGIGQVESVHGAYDGAEVDERGDVEPHITGVPLDGSEGVLEIPDTDEGELDGDEEWDRAVGPMQFIPQTWQRYTADGNQDGEADVHNIDDAALAAATYLCDEGSDLTTDRGWNDAVTAYNQSVQYANEVADYAEGYLGR
nr:lytic murein transglycosylase [Garicola koreensis]